MRYLIVTLLVLCAACGTQTSEQTPTECTFTNPSIFATLRATGADTDFTQGVWYIDGDVVGVAAYEDEMFWLCSDDPQLRSLAESYNKE